MLTRVKQNLTISCAENNISQDQINKLNMTMNLWTEFISIYKKLKSGLNKNDSEEIKHRTREWLRLFFNLYHDTHETPYIHFFFHLHDLNKIHGDINQFNQEGHEKFNHTVIRNVQSSTNRKTTTNSSQLLQANLLRNSLFIDYLSIFVILA